MLLARVNTPFIIELSRLYGTINLVLIIHFKDMSFCGFRCEQGTSKGYRVIIYGFRLFR